MCILILPIFGNLNVWFSVRFLIGVFAVSVAIVNVLSVRLAARTQVLFSVIKVGGLLVIIGGGIYSLVKGIRKTNVRYLYEVSSKTN